MREEKKAAPAAMQCVECNSCGSAFDIDTYMAGYTDGKGHCLNCPGINRAATEAAPAAVAGPSEDVRKKIETNTWDHFGDILPTLKAISRGEWYWGENSRCKYIEIRLDTRDGGCILYDRDRVRISPEQFAFQAGGGVGKMEPWPAKNALAAAPTTQAAPQQEAQEPIGQCCYGGLRPKAACASCSAWRQGIGQAAPVAQGDALSYEQSYAIRQGHEIASSDAYFKARPQIDGLDRRSVFRAGFDRGWDAARAQAKEGGT